MIYGFTIPNSSMALPFNTGHSNGYIAIPEDHPWYGKHYDDIDADVHGGLTFSRQMDDNIRENAIGELPETDDYWVIGFDTCHYSDNLKSCPLSYVLAEVEKLKAQAEAVIS